MKALGFVGLGVMGQPMALNLARAGTPLVIWNRTPQSCAPLEAVGAHVALTADDVFHQCETVLMMLADEQAIDEVLARNTDWFAELVRDRTIVQMGTVNATYSRSLADDIGKVGGRYVEAPVSGSRGPAEAGQLVGMLAGDPADRARVRGIIKPLCGAVFECGEVPSALVTKFAVNLFLITMVTGLAEAFHFAEQLGIDLTLFDEIIDAGPMASTVSRAKSAKLIHGDFDVQASLTNVLKNNLLIAEAARDHHVASPLLDACHSLYGEAVDLGYSSADMAAVIHALRARTASP